MGTDRNTLFGFAVVVFSYSPGDGHALGLHRNHVCFGKGSPTPASQRARRFHACGLLTLAAVPGAALDTGPGKMLQTKES